MSSSPKPITSPHHPRYPPGHHVSHEHSARMLPDFLVVIQDKSTHGIQKPPTSTQRHQASPSLTSVQSQSTPIPVFSHMGTTASGTHMREPVTAARRPRVSSPTSDDEGEDLPAPKVPRIARSDHATSTHVPKPKAWDFGLESQSTILLACRYYCMLIATDNGFPTKLEQDQFAREAWELAIHDQETQMNATPQVYHVVCFYYGIALGGCSD